MNSFLLGWVLLIAVTAEEGTESETQPKPAASAPITALAVSPDSKHLVVGSQAGARLFLLERIIAAQKNVDSENQAEPHAKANRARPSIESMNVDPSATFPTELEHIHDLCFSPGGDRLVLAGGSPSEHGGLEVYNWPEAKLLRRETVHDDLIYGVDIDAQNKWIATVSGDGTVKLMRLPDLDQSIKLAGHSQRVLDVRFLPDGKNLVSVSVDQTIRVWSVESEKAVRALSNHLDAVTCVEVRPHETRLSMVATASADKTVRLWQPTIGRMVRFKRFETEPVSLAWNPDGRLLWIGMDDGHLISMLPETAELQRAIQISDARLNQLAVSPDGQWIFAGDSLGRLFCISSQ